MLEGCPVLGWAASGGMALTGHADGPPVASPSAAFGLLSALAGELAAVTGATGVEVRVDPGELVRRAQVDAEDPRLLCLAVRLGEQLDGLRDAPGALLQLAERHQGVGLR